MAPPCLLPQSTFYHILQIKAYFGLSFDTKNHYNGYIWFSSFTLDAHPAGPFTCQKNVLTTTLQRQKQKSLVQIMWFFLSTLIGKSACIQRIHLLFVTKFACMQLISSNSPPFNNFHEKPLLQSTSTGKLLLVCFPCITMTLPLVIKENMFI